MAEAEQSVPWASDEDIERAGINLLRAIRSSFASSVAELSLRDASAQLGIDRGLAWKLQRLLTTDDPLLALHESPSAPGLQKLAAAAGRSSETTDAQDRLREAAEELGRLLDRFPDGRNGLRAALCHSIPQAKTAADRDARRMLAQATSHLHGFAADVSYTIMVLRPAPDGRDAILRARAAGLFGFRRLRRDRAHRVLVTIMPEADAVDRDDWLLTTLDGGASDELGDYLLPEYTTVDTDDMRIERDGRHCTLWCPPHAPPINRPGDLVFGQRAGQLSPRYRTDSDDYSHYAFSNRMGSGVLVVDLLLHRDAFPDADPPQLVQTMVTEIDPRNIKGPPSSIPAPLDQPVEVMPLGMGLGRSGSPDVDAAPALLADVFARLGEDPGEYRLYRYRQTYPVPQGVWIFWFPLPDRPEDAG
ncbi:MAG: hypothetical protein RIB58_05450 [Phycisphaerales bacterium]